jgi:hypothetical protein
MNPSESADRPRLQVAVLMRRERVPGAMSRWQTWRWVVADVVPHESGFGSEARCLLQTPDEERWLHPDDHADLICDCNQTMPLNAKALGEALHEDLTLHSTLCRREAGAFQRAIQSGEPVVVACTQEKRLFADLGQQTEGALSPIRFVNIRETGGWSRDAGKASPKIAALLAAAHLPDPAPVPTVTFKSAGRCSSSARWMRQSRRPRWCPMCWMSRCSPRAPATRAARRHGVFRCWAGASRA